jgi:thiamine biosynthesis protein ThiI
MDNIMVTSTPEIVVVHYGEIALKGKNRIFFEKRLQANIKKSLAGLSFERIQRLRGRFIIRLHPDTDRNAVTARLTRVFGISYFSYGVQVESDLAVLQETAWRLLSAHTFDSFRIATRRSQKGFPLTSVDINRQIGAFVVEKCEKRVDLKQPDIVCYIEITEKGALLYTGKISGLRGLPSGVSEKAICLLSSGIDSPVAAFKMLKRGVNLIYVHFHSQPFTSNASQENTKKLVQVLNTYQLRSRVYFTPFIDIQKEIMAKAPSSLRILLYRRYMVRLAERIARQEKAKAIVTGESVGQVASQTLSNIRVISEATVFPILRPLAGDDKEEIVEQALKIGTFDISTEPYEDCCSLFVPSNPETKAHPRLLSEAESALDMEALMEQALQNSEVCVMNCYE